MSVAVYRNERMPPWEFLEDLKRIDENLYVIYDSTSLRWHIWFKDREGGTHLIYKVCERDHEGRDIGAMPLDNRVINKILRMDMARRNLNAQAYLKKVRQAEDDAEQAAEKKADEDADYIFKHEKCTINRARDALRGVYRTF